MDLQEKKLFICLTSQKSMDYRRPLLAALFLTVAATIGTTVLFSSSELIGYASLSVCFLIPLALASLDYPRTAVFGATIAAATAIFIVADPIELGLFGHDSYYTLGDAEAFRELPLNSFLAVNPFPAYYALVTTAATLLNIGLETVGKWAGIICAVYPVLFYAVFQKRTSERAAAISAIGVAAIQTLLYFEAKFVDEQLAVLLFPIVLFGVLDDRSRVWGISALALVVITFTHHFSTLVITGISMAMLLLQSLSYPNVPRLLAFTDRAEPHRWWRIVFTGILAAIPFVFQALGVTAMVSRGFLGINPSPDMATGGVGGSAGSLVQLVSSWGGRVATAMMGLVALLTVFSAKKDHWEFGWAMVGGGLLAAFVGTLAVGNTIELAPIRTFIFMLPILLGVLATRVDRFGSRVRKAATVLVATFVVTQVFGIAPNVLLTDASEGSISGGHYTGDEFAAAGFVSEFSTESVVGYERELWEAVAGTLWYEEGTIECSTRLRVYRDEVALPPPSGIDIVYSAGNTQLEKCG